MPRERLHQALEALHSELESGAALNAEDRARLAELAGDVGRVLEASEPDESLGVRAERAATEFEAAHPRIAAVLHEIVETLARIGI